MSAIRRNDTRSAVFSHEQVGIFQRISVLRVARAFSPSPMLGHAIVGGGAGPSVRWNGPAPILITHKRDSSL